MKLVSKMFFFRFLLIFCFLLGKSVFENVVLAAKNDFNCILQFNVINSPGFHILPQNCSVLLYGCETGQRIITGTTEDTCKTSN